MAKLTINGRPVANREEAERVVLVVLPDAVLAPVDPIGPEWDLALPAAAADTLDRQGWIEIEKGPFAITIGDPDADEMV